MTTLPPPPATRQPDWALLLLFALLAGGAVYALYHAYAMQSALNTALVSRQNDLRKRVAALEAVQSTSVKTDMLRALESDLAASRAAVATLTQRLESVEQTATAPAPTITFTAPAMAERESIQQFMALKTALESGAAYDDALAAASMLAEVKAVQKLLQPTAKDGLASEADLRDTLRDWLAAHPATVVVEDAKLARVNHSLKGLFSIKRKEAAAVDDYAALRAQATAEASLDVLLHSAQALPEASRAPLAAWIDRAAKRQAAVGALRAAETALAKPAH